MLLLLFCLLIAASLAFGAPVVELVNISNVRLRRDRRGEMMDIHDGNILSITDSETGAVVYHYYGMAYHNCTIQHSWFPPRWCPGIYEPFGQCGFRTDHMIRLYTSPDLHSWTLGSENVLPLNRRPYGIYFRPKVIFCPTTSKYVLWVNYLPNASSPLAAFPNAKLLVATSATIDGPFEVLHHADGLGHHGPGDFTLMVVSFAPGDSRAYIAYGAWSTDHTISIEQLDENFTNSLGLKRSSGLLSPPGNEAPILFHRRGFFYLIFGECCCFCQQGAGATVYVASSPLGPWNTTMGSLGTVDINPVLNESTRVISSQNNYVFQIPSAAGGGKAAAYVWMGDRWASAHDGLFGHNLQSWHLLEFDGEGLRGSAPSIRELTWEDWFLLNVTTSV